MRSLPRSFFQKPTLWVAKNLLEKTIVRKWQGREIRATICETEAYIGASDRACHASRGRIPRTEVLFWKAGHAYVYLIYGMHYCFNIVTEKENFPSAVLIRGICVPGKCIKGPGRVSKFLHINKGLHGKDLVKDSARAELSLISATPAGSGIFNLARRAFRDRGAEPRTNGSSAHTRELKIKCGLRIGVEYAGSWAKKPWRFWVEF